MNRTVGTFAISADGGLVAMMAYPAFDTHLEIYNGTNGQPVAFKPAKLNAVAMAFHPAQSQLLVGVNEQLSEYGLRLFDVATAKEIWSVHKLMQIERIAFSPKGDVVAVMERRDQWRIKLLDSATGKLLHDLPADKRSMHGMTFSPDGKYIAAVRNNFFSAPVAIYDVQTGQLFKELTEGLEKSAVANDIAFLPDGKSLAVASYDYHIHLIDIETGKTTGIITNALKSDAVLQFGDMFLLPDGKNLLVNCRNRELRIFRVADALAYPQ